VRSLTTQSRVSTVAVLGTTYFIAALMWRNDPQRMEAFLATALGQQLVAAAILLQAVGIVWSSSLAKMRY
jgi:tight adherence protein B